MSQFGRVFIRVVLPSVLLVMTATSVPAQKRRPYRLSSVDLQQRIIWDAQCRQPDGAGLAFGGQDQDADDGRPHTRILVNGKWQAIHTALRQANRLQRFHHRLWRLRTETRNTLAKARYIYFQGRAIEEERAFLQQHVVPRLQSLRRDIAELSAALQKAGRDEYQRRQAAFALEHMASASALLTLPGETVEAGEIKALHRAQIHLELASEALDAEPPPRAMNCGPPRRKGSETPPSRSIVYDVKTGLYVMFGGDHLDYLTNDTWVFDPSKRRWFQRHPPAAPPPRANHRLTSSGNGTVMLSGGYTYASNTDYVGGQYLDLDDGEWTYDIAKNKWFGGRLVPADQRVYRTGPFHPDYYLQGEKPSAAHFEARWKSLPVNTWVATNPPYRPRLNRDWGCARLDPVRDIMLRWSGGHSAHGGTDVPHFHFATNRWELPFPVEFPLGQLYSNTSYPNGYNFNLRPWMTGHTYQNYAFDLPSGKMIKAGRPRHFYIYDPAVGDWIGRGQKPPAMQYNSCFYTLTLTSTPRGIVCWDRNGRVHRYDHAAGGWKEIKLTGEKLPGAYVDNSCIAYDAQRDRVLIINTPGYRKPYSGQIYALDLKTGRVRALSPLGMQHARSFAYVDRCCYDASHDLLIMATYLKDQGARTRTPAYDCAQNRWITLDWKYATGMRLGRITRAFPHGRSCGLMFDPKRKLLWGTDTNSQVYVLRLDLKTADAQPLSTP